MRSRRLNAPGPSFAQRYAWRQLELMQAEGLSEAAARERVDAEVAAAQKRVADAAAAAASGTPAPAAVPAPPSASEWMSAPPTPKRMMAAVQAEEDAVLRRRVHKGDVGRRA